MFLEDQFPEKLRTLIPPAIKKAYEAADSLALDSPILQVGSALGNSGRLRAWAADLAIERLIQTGQLPFDYDWANYAKPTGKYLRIRLESSLMSVSLVARPKKPPRKVIFRNNNALGNPQFDLFPDTQSEVKIEGLPNFVLVHGHTKPDFAHIGMPNPNLNRWGYISSNLMSLPHQIKSIDAVPVEAADEEAVLSLKQELEKWQKDNNDH